jgi:hypothetical protein
MHIYMIKDGNCFKSRDHYRQPNSCSFSYTHSCTYNRKWRYSHEFLSIAQCPHYILTSTDSIVYKLIRFVQKLIKK